MSNKLFAFGSNGSGQLGLGHNDDTASPQAVTRNDSHIAQIAAGGNHTIVLYTDGEANFYGLNASGQCGQLSQAAASAWTQVAATWTTSILLHQDGTIFTCGEGLNGELGLGGEKQQTQELTRIPSFPPQGTSIAQISSSMAHTVAILSNGEVWGWGKNRKGQLGEPNIDVWSPRKVEGLPFAAAKAVCGKDFTYIVSAHGEGKAHLLGLPKNDRFGLRASLPRFVPDWKDIAASWGSVFVLKDNGELHGFGRDDHGQLPPSGLPAVAAIAAGTWGWGEHGNCGEPTNEHGDVNGRWKEMEVHGQIASIAAGCATSFLVITG
ncbi:alpha tubulin suppressor [Recurvomyces mirabilis]|uniref:Alpha tubulin suppressor n=1 Tax=Recurvomyces mirabilis TaxID=574656 RepID=A0AAE1C5Y1_9PEZI|nr:alpha tubulin suppressor [Recurvomyces mirabilis]KAK5158874.1 alpha tubulin suppressor [Recurvomyces mirabilis]